LLGIEKMRTLLLLFGRIPFLIGFMSGQQDFLHGKKILVGVCGSIAAYKSALLVRLLVKAGAQVRVLMTKAAQTFITPLTLATLSKNEVLTDWANEQDGVWHNHVELGLWADAFVLYPASANSLAKMANGLCDNLLLATYLSARCPVWVAPAMDLDMYAHPSFERNLKSLLSFGNHLIEAEEGELASGLEGKGRLAEPEKVVALLSHFFAQKKAHSEQKDKIARHLAGKKVLISAGATKEALDPVRYLSNHSTGKMGFALAKAAQQAGAEVFVVSGANHLHAQFENEPRLHLIPVSSAAEMLAGMEKIAPQADVLIFAAAVSDYRPAEVSPTKIKKNEDSLTLQLVKNPDIALILGQKKKPHQFHVGFALETHDEILHAQEKLRKKNFDLIVLNSLREEGAGFGHDTNKVYILDGQSIKEFKRKPKHAVAQDIWQEVVLRLEQQGKRKKFEIGQSPNSTEEG
jgi:phosphopantothenoylcysteine decarboxylase/phosphopantothenate--cysteine ligase